VPRILPNRDHIPVHRLWAFTTLDEGLTLPEHAHVAYCAECTAALRACLSAETFGTALKELSLDQDGLAVLDEKPKLRFLYVITGEKRPADLLS
jgi:hypothetical protein